MNATAKAPAGMSMMLKALGVDPNVIVQVGDAVKTIARTLEENKQTLHEILEMQKKILGLLAPESTNGNGKH